MSKTNSKTTSTKATKRAKSSKSAPKTATAPKSATTATETKEKATPKSTGIVNEGLTKQSEAVGTHFSICKTWLDDKQPTPEIGSLVMVETTKGEQVPLIVRTVQPKVNGDLFVQAFLVEKGSGHHEVLGKAKDSMVKVFWA